MNTNKTKIPIRLTLSVVAACFCLRATVYAATIH